MRRLFKNIGAFMHLDMKTPDWVHELMNVRAKQAEEQGKAAWACMGGAAPGEPASGDLANAKPKVPVKATKWNPKNRGLEKPPRGHLDDRANFDDGKDNKSRPIGTQARFATTHGGRSRFQLHRWCVCDERKAEDNKGSPTYPGHWRTTQGNPINSNTHKNVGEDGSTFNKFKVQVYKPAASASAKRKSNAASAATSDTISTVADQDLKRAKAHIDHLNNQIRELGESRDAEHLEYAKATELANTQLNLQAKTINEMINLNAKALRSSQNETVKAIAKISSIRGHAEGLAENILHNAANGQAPDLVTTWSACSGLLDPQTIDAADWGERTKRPVSKHSKQCPKRHATSRHRAGAKPRVRGRATARVPSLPGGLCTGPTPVAARPPGREILSASVFLNTKCF